MRITTVADFGQHLKSFIKYSVEETEPVFIALEGGRNLVTISLNEFDKLRGSVTSQNSDIGQVFTAKCYKSKNIKK